MHLESVYALPDGTGFIAEFAGPIDIELVVLDGYLAVWLDSETGAVIGDVEVGNA
jgi:hypothetical protein